MQVRPVKEGEYKEACRAESIAFDIGLDFTDPKAADNPDGYKVRRAVFEDGKIVSCLDLIPFRALLNNKEVGMSGIGGVVSLPEERHKGYVRELFRYVLKESYEKGDAISYLYPFSNKYYRQFGYENSMTKNEITVSTDAFAVYRNRDRVKLFIPGEDESEIRGLYKEFSCGKNCMVVRSEREWKKKIGADPYKNCRYVYVHYDSDNKADSYIILVPDRHEDILTAEEFVFLNVNALIKMLGFVYNYAGRYPKFRFTAPSFINFKLLAEEPYDVKTNSICFGMTRVVNVVRALETIDLDGTVKEVNIAVKDDFLSFNNGVFSIKSENGKTTVKKTENEPDFFCDVRTLSQLLTGYVSLKEAVYMGLAAVKSDIKGLDKFFTKGLPCIYDEF